MTYKTILDILNRCKGLRVYSTNGVDIWVRCQPNVDFHAKNVQETYDAICRRSQAVIEQAYPEWEERIFLCGGANVVWVI